METPSELAAGKTRKASLFWGPLSALGLTLAVFTFALDQAHKWWMLEIFDIAARQPFTVFPGFDLVITWNRGISYGWFSSHAAEAQWVLIGVSLIVSAFLWRWMARVNRPLTAAALGLIIGGALANALDRLRFGAVADFFHFYVGNFSWYIFNLADIAIVAGVALLLYESVKEGRKAS